MVIQEAYVITVRKRALQFYAVRIYCEWRKILVALDKGIVKGFK
ncbi:MAG: hypothetical protein ACTSX9_03665 [Candidatus Njordarchaeales archaeon]